MRRLIESLAVASARCLGRLPLGLARRLGACLGVLTYHLPVSARKATQRNIAHCLKHLSAAEQRQLTRQSLIETGKLAFESLVIWRMNAEDLAGCIHQVIGEEHAARAPGQGLLILGPHLGNWEVLGRYIPRLGPVTSMFQPPKLPRMGDLMKAGRQASGAQLVATDRRGLAAVLNNLKQGGISGVLPDQTPRDPQSGSLAPFFGEPAFTMTLVYKLVQASGCKVIFGYAKRQGPGFVVVFNPAPPGIYSEIPEVALAALNQGVEDAVRQVPEQYQWEYRRFKRNQGPRIYD